MLILNAGVFALPHEQTEDGFERTFQGTLDGGLATSDAVALACFSESSVQLFAGATAGTTTADISPLPSDRRVFRKSSAVLPLEAQHFGRVFVADDILTLCSPDGVQRLEAVQPPLRQSIE